MEEEYEAYVVELGEWVKAAKAAKAADWKAADWNSGSRGTSQSDLPRGLTLGAWAERASCGGAPT